MYLFNLLLKYLRTYLIVKERLSSSKIILLSLNLVDLEPSVTPLNNGRSWSYVIVLKFIALNVGTIVYQI